jgi:hypothetical protein
MMISFEWKKDKEEFSGNMMVGMTLILDLV